MRIDRTTTLILKGGGIKGLAFTGALEQLEDAGFTFKTYVGTSAGAVATVLLAAGHSGRSLHELLDATDFAAFQDAGPLRRLVNFVFRGGLYPGDLLRNWVVTNVRGKSALADKQRYPLVKMKDLGRKGSRALVFASHTLVGTITFDSHGENADTDVGHAVRLSCSIPGFFVPGDYQGHRVYDGGLLHNFPIEVYQRVRATPPAHGDEDFIALYLGSTPAQEVRRGWRKCWAPCISFAILATTGAGVPVGATNPNQDSTSKPGYPCSAIGLISGACGIRAIVDAPIALSLPDFK